MNIHIPSDFEIAPIGNCLDQLSAVKHFSGLNRIEATQLFLKDEFSYSENLIFMGKVAFSYYIVSYFSYLEQSDLEDLDMVSIIIFEDLYKRAKEDKLLKHISQFIKTATYLEKNLNVMNLTPRELSKVSKRLKNIILQKGKINSHTNH